MLMRVGYLRSWQLFLQFDVLSREVGGIDRRPAPEGARTQTGLAVSRPQSARFGRPLSQELTGAWAS